MILIVAALKEELLPLIQHYRALEKKLLVSGTIYLSEKIHFLRTGVGTRKAGETLSAYLRKYQPNVIINIGTAGALCSLIDNGKVVEVKYIKNEQAEEICLMPMQTGQIISEGLCLLTVNEAILNQHRKEKLLTDLKVDIVDMEAFILAKIAQNHGIDFHCIKIISDQADEHTIKDFKKKYKGLTKKLSKYIIDYLDPYF